MGVMETAQSAIRAGNGQSEGPGQGSPRGIHGQESHNSPGVQNLLIDLNKTLKRYYEITGQEADADYVQAIMEKCLDTQTLQYMLGLGINDMVEYRNKAIGFATMVLQSTRDKTGVAPMDLGRMEGRDGSEEGADREEEGEGEAVDRFRLSAQLALKRNAAGRQKGLRQVGCSR